MTSASAFDKFTFSAENTDEEYSIDEPIEVDTAIEDKQEEKKINSCRAFYYRMLICRDAVAGVWEVS